MDSIKYSLLLISEVITIAPRSPSRSSRGAGGAGRWWPRLTGRGKWGSGGSLLTVHTDPSPAFALAPAPAPAPAPTSPSSLATVHS